jgi:hypothetical protein
MKNVTLKDHTNSVGVYVDGVLYKQYARWEDAQDMAEQLRSVDRDRLDRCVCAVPCPGFKCDRCNIERPWCLGAWDDEPDSCDDCWAKNRNTVNHNDRDDGPVEWSESYDGQRALERWASDYDSLNGGPESDDDR